MDSRAALGNRDWSGAEVVTDRPRAKIVHSVRLPAEWSEALEAEADRRGTTPSRLSFRARPSTSKGSGLDPLDSGGAARSDR